MGKNLGELDKAMSAGVVNRDGMDWYTVDDPGFELNGFYWRKPGDLMRRIPLDMTVSEELDELAWNTAGGMLRFKSDATEIRITVELAHYFNASDNMTPLGGRGFDLYVGSGSAKYFARVGRFDPSQNAYTTELFGPVTEKKMREFTINFPLYAGIAHLEIGLSEGAVVQSPSPWCDPRPIVYYGTSIQQGGSASRPGMSANNQMSRLLNRPFLNFGFSGNGRGEPVMAELLAEIEDPAMYILEYDANAGSAGLRATLANFIEILRKKHPEVPILQVSKMYGAKEVWEGVEYNENRLALTDAHLNVLRQRRAAGDKNIHYLDGMNLYGTDPSECTIDGTHPTDLGFYFEAHRMAPVIRNLLENR